MPRRAAIAVAVCSAAGIIDFEGVVIDGALPQALVDRVCGRIDEHLNQQDFTGIVRPKMVPGTIGNDARALGGAILPFYSSFAPDKDLLLNFDLGTDRRNSRAV